MARMPLYTVTLTGDTATVTLDSEVYTFTHGANPWDLHAWAHGIKQKIGDAGAIPRNPETGRSATPAEKLGRMQALASRLAAGGAWNERAEGGAGEDGLLFRALCEFYTGRKTPAEVREFLAAQDKAHKDALRANRRIAPIIERLRAAAVVDIDSDALLDDLTD